MTSYKALLPGGKILLNNMYQAKTIAERLKGLLGRNSLPDGEGLLIEPCTSVHTAFMRFPIDVVFLDKFDRVTAWHVNVRPNRILLAPWGTRKTLEFAGGALANRLTKKDQILFERNSDTPEPIQ